MRDLTVLDNLIIGRVDPHIYAFTTNTVPNYLKVGDTYRPVSVRLREWREHFPDLQKEYEHVAKVSDEVFFRDFAVHYFLEQERTRIRLVPDDLPVGSYYSREFFKEATARDVADAVDDIQQDFASNTGRYRFYNATTMLPAVHTYVRSETYPPRPNQDKTIAQFKTAKDSGRTNLLMYAVMRFGKSFTSMCCATEMKAEVVVVVSAKADVREEWKKTVESHVRFADYEFITSEQLLADDNVIKDLLAAGKKVVVFLTLQDLQGETIKEKHREIFSRSIDLLIVDEAHFGARAEKYGRVLRAEGKQHSGDSDDFIEAAEAEEQIKFLDARIRLHLSGTPYRILMGSEFSKEDIIAFYQFTDIVKDQENWIRENNAKPEDEQKEEWANPYYGFPQMIRFAFNPNESSRRRLRELHESGASYAFSALLKPKSVKKADDGSHKQFVFEQEILDLLSVIDGSKDDDELLGFLDYDKIKTGSMCRHIVCVLPYCASCDAMEALIRSHGDSFKNLCDYEIINISGVDRPNAYRSPAEIKRKIRECEDAGRKTLTLTVNRMLTGSTVEQWDTMLFLKDTASPQEYDQAIFRLQNQFIKTYKDDDGNTIKVNKKPQTLLVDFMPDRMFRMQEQKSQIYNVNVDEAGNSRLEDRIREELRVSPIIVMNSDKIEQVQASDILHAVSEYSKTRGVAEETAEIPVDLSLLDIASIRTVIEKENELGSKAGFSTKAHEGNDEGSDLDVPDSGNGSGEDAGQGTDQGDDGQSSPQEDTRDNKTGKDLVKQFRSYYARILFFAFLTRDTVISLEDIITNMETPDNARIARNIGVSKPVLETMRANINKFILRDLDYKIQNLNRLSHDDSVDPVERASVAVRKFGKLGESEVITPKNICEEMIALVPNDGLANAVYSGHKILDIAGKAGEFAIAVYERLKALGFADAEIRDSIYTIPTSGITYEFTRLIYEILGLNINSIASRFDSYQLLTVKDRNGRIDYDTITALLTQAKPFDTITLNDTVAEGDEKVKFDVVVGNPPYQEAAPGTSTSDKPIFHLFMDIAYSIAPIANLVVPARFLSNAGATPQKWNYKMLNDEHFKVLKYEPDSQRMFPSTLIPGGIAITYRDENQVFGAIKDFFLFEELSSICEKVNGQSTVSLNTIMHSQNKFNLPALYRDFPEMEMKIGNNGRDKRFRQIIMERFPAVFVEHGGDGYLRVLGLIKKQRDYRFIKRQYVENENWIDKYKVFVPFSNGASGTLGTDSARIISRPVVGYPGDCITQTFISVGCFNTEEEAKNLLKYIKSKFARVMLAILKVTQGNKAETWRYVPIQDFSCESDIDWSKTISEIDDQLFEKYGLSDDEVAFIEAKIAPLE